MAREDGAGLLPPVERILDTHIHLSQHYAASPVDDTRLLPNVWHPAESNPRFHRDFTEADYRAHVEASGISVGAGGTGGVLRGAVFVECFNSPPEKEAEWVVKMVEDPRSLVVGLVAQVCVQKGTVALVAGGRGGAGVRAERYGCARWWWAWWRRCACRKVRLRSLVVGVVVQVCVQKGRRNGCARWCGVVVQVCVQKGTVALVAGGRGGTGVRAER